MKEGGVGVEELCTYEALSQKMKAVKELARSKGSELYSNCYFLPEGFKNLIKEHRLFFEENYGNLYLFMKERSFFRFYYYIQDAEAVRSLTVTSPIETELLFRDKLTEKQQREATLIRQLGFSLGRQSSRMSQSADKVQIYPYHLNDPDMQISFAGTEDKDIVCRMLRDTFHPMFSFLPDEKQLMHQIAKNNILTLRSHGKIIGLLNMEPVKRSVWIRQLVIMKELRGTGLGTVLLNQYHMLWKDKVDSFMHWVDLSNRPAVGLYQKAGYHFDDTKSDSYFMENPHEATD